MSPELERAIAATVALYAALEEHLGTDGVLPAGVAEEAQAALAMLTPSERLALAAVLRASREPTENWGASAGGAGLRRSDRSRLVG